MGLKKDYPPADPASTPASEQDQPYPLLASWLPMEDAPLGPERSHFRECALSIFPYALRRDQDDPRTSWRVVFSDGGKRLGVESDQIAARLAAEACARENTCDHCHGRTEDGLCTVGGAIDCAIDLDRVARVSEATSEREPLPMLSIHVDPNDLESVARAHRMLDRLLGELS